MAGASQGATPECEQRLTPVFDIDILVMNALAQSVEEVVRKYLQETRHKYWYALACRLSALRYAAAQIPFKKIIRTLVEYRMERPTRSKYLADGQQLAVAGIYPETNAPLCVAGRIDRRSTHRAARVPLVNEHEVQEILALCVQGLRDELGLDGAVGG